MRRRIRRQSPLAQHTLSQAENLLSSSLPPEMQAVLSQLQKNLQDVHSMIDQQLFQTRALSARAYADLSSPGAAQASALDSTQSTPATDADAHANTNMQEQQILTQSMNAVQAKLGEMNQVINRKVASMTQQIAARSQQVSAQADAIQNYTQAQEQNPAVDRT